MLSHGRRTRTEVPDDRKVPVRAGLVLVGLVGCGDTMERVLARDGDPEAGARVFAAHCSECHGAGGEGGEGPDLRDDDDTREALAEKVLWGWGEMTGFVDVLSIRETADVVAFVSEEIQQPPVR